MRTQIPIFLAAVLIFRGGKAASADLIDAFDQPVAPVGGMVIFSAPPNDPVQLTTMIDSNALGSNRGVYGQRFLVPGDSNAVNFEIGGQQEFRVVNSTSGDASAKLLYGFGAFTNGNVAQEMAVQTGSYASTILPQSSLNSSFDPAGAFSFEYQNNGIVTDLQVAIVTGRNEGNSMIFNSSMFVLPQSPTDTTFVIPFSSFGNANASTFSDIDQIIFSFGIIPANTVFAVDNLRGTMTAVPEPSSVATLGLFTVMSIGGWMWRRRQAASLEQVS